MKIKIFLVLLFCTFNIFATKGNFVREFLSHEVIKACYKKDIDRIKYLFSIGACKSAIDHDFGQSPESFVEIYAVKNSLYLDEAKLINAFEDHKFKSKAILPRINESVELKTKYKKFLNKRLIIACINYDHKNIKTLLSLGADPNFQYKPKQYKKRLLDLAIDPNVQDEYMERPSLQYAIIADDIKFVKRLIAAGANPLLTDTFAFNSFHLACSLKTEKIISFLVSLGNVDIDAGLSALNCFRETANHVAKRNTKNDKIIEIVVKAEESETEKRRRQMKSISDENFKKNSLSVQHFQKSLIPGLHNKNNNSQDKKAKRNSTTL